MIPALLSSVTMPLAFAFVQWSPSHLGQGLQQHTGVVSPHKLLG